MPWGSSSATNSILLPLWNCFFQSWDIGQLFVVIVQRTLPIVFNLITQLNLWWTPYWGGIRRMIEEWMECCISQLRLCPLLLACARIWLLESFGSACQRTRWLHTAQSLRIQGSLLTCLLLVADLAAPSLPILIIVCFSSRKSVSELEVFGWNWEWLSRCRPLLYFYCIVIVAAFLMQIWRIQHYSAASNRLLH